MVVGYVSVSKADQHLPVEAQRREMEREMPLERSRMAGSCGLTASTSILMPKHRTRSWRRGSCGKKAILFARSLCTWVRWVTSRGAAGHGTPRR
jgi:hypothetical protein